MIANREMRRFTPDVRVWAGRFRNSHNLPHWHYACELICVESGSVDVFCDRRTQTLRAGGAMLIETGKVHYMHAGAQDTVLGVIFYDDGIVRPYVGDACLESPCLSDGYSFPGHYARVRDALLSGRRYRGGEAACEILRFVLEIYSHENTVPMSEMTGSNAMLRRLLEELDAHCDQYTFNDAVSFMSMSPGYFSRFFREGTGLTFSEYLNFARTEKAVRLLQEGGHSMTEIAEACGFGTIRTFNRVFRELTGYAPSALPKGFILDGSHASRGADVFDPTRADCELIESTDAEGPPGTGA